MKYFYMICLTLSSFFTYKYLFAAEQATQYAFFIPNNSFQNNIYEEEENERQSVQPSKQISNQPTKEHKQGYQSQRIKVSQPVVHKTLDFKPTGKTTKPNDPSPHSPKDDFKDHLQDHSTPNNKSRDNLDNQQRHRPGNHHRPAENRRRPPD
ncbi:MAG: hypothetical protein J6W96_02355, partial [Alphaproteobacteria bacterium]|nr:hypothetical protein [Alphaproteobacteria bacterium]